MHVVRVDVIGRGSYAVVELMGAAVIKREHYSRKPDAYRAAEYVARVYGAVNVSRGIH